MTTREKNVDVCQTLRHFLVLGPLQLLALVRRPRRARCRSQSCARSMGRCWRTASGVSRRCSRPEKERLRVGQIFSRRHMCHAAITFGGSIHRSAHRSMRPTWVCFGFDETRISRSNSRDTTETKYKRASENKCASFRQTRSVTLKKNCEKRRDRAPDSSAHTSNTPSDARASSQGWGEKRGGLRSRSCRSRTSRGAVSGCRGLRNFGNRGRGLAESDERFGHGGHRTSRARENRE